MMWQADPIPLLTTPVIPVLTIQHLDHAVPLVRALAAGGLPVVEVTLRTKIALEAVRMIIAEVPDVVVGVGTVTNRADVSHACDAGAAFLASPGTSHALAEALTDTQSLKA
jgi:2-dehydro-3-deoxyphosphogluconate aldolase/(4S)-4-hydroxy-2-oxoglutarate aldolase